MRQPILRATTVFLFLGLLSGFVMYKSGLFGTKRSAVPASRVLFPTTMSSTTAPGLIYDEFKTFAGSKSGVVITRDELPSGEKNPFEPRVMGGSKSLSPIFPPAGSTMPIATQPTTKPE